MLIVDAKTSPQAPATEELRLPFEARCKSRLRTRLVGGEECDLFLERGTVMRHGDRLLARDGRVIAVVAADEDLLEARSGDPLLLARAAYHLGNRHVALAIAPGAIRFGRDHVLGDMVRGLGLDVGPVVAPFEPEAGAYGGSHGAHGGHSHPHGHSAEGEGRGPRIHDHFGDGAGT
jgi:urease accessory protein